MAVKVLWCLGAVVIAAMQISLPVKSQCTAKHCYDDEEADVLKMFMRIQGSMERQEQHMASMKEELSSLKEQISSLKENLTVCCKFYIMLYNIEENMAMSSLSFHPKYAKQMQHCGC